MTDNKWVRNGFVWIVLIIAVVAIWFTWLGGSSKPQSVDFSVVANDIKAGKVESLDTTEGSNNITVHYIGTDNQIDASPTGKREHLAGSQLLWNSARCGSDQGECRQFVGKLDQRVQHLDPHGAADRHLHFYDETGAGLEQSSHVIRQEPRPNVYR